MLILIFFLPSIYRFSHLRFVNYDELVNLPEPLEPIEFEKLIIQQCQKTREILRKKYVFF